MSKRLQVILRDPEYREIQKAARSQQMPIAEWVRQALRVALVGQSSGDVRRKLQAIRTAARYDFPIGDIDTMLAEIETGYAGTTRIG